MELPLTHGIHHLRLQAEMAQVRQRQNNALLAGQTATLTNFEETFDLLDYATNRFHFHKLID